jgi:cytochrome P450
VRLIILALVQNPDIQERAREEIDQVTEGRRLPRMEDREATPYLNAVITECLRWHQIVPFGRLVLVPVLGRV